MYGIVNKGIRNMVIKNHGAKVWEQISKEAKCEEQFFQSMQAYDDSLTYNLVGAASKILGFTPHQILVGFGEYWIKFTAQEGYGNLLSMAGNTFPEFLSNLDNLHLRLGTTYKNLKPPSFVCKEIDANTLLLEYHSSREGLSSLVIGLLIGLGKIFHVSIDLKHTKERETFGFDEFLINHHPIENAKTMNITKENNESNTKAKCPFSRFASFTKAK